MLFIIIIIIVIYALVIAWTWNSLWSLEKPKKILIILIGILLVIGITQILFSLSKQGIQYPKEVVENDIRNLLVMAFSGINSLVIPLVARLFRKYQEGDIEKKVFLTRIVVIGILFLVCLGLERGYMKDTQEGILQIYQSNMEK